MVTKRYHPLTPLYHVRVRVCCRPWTGVPVLLLFLIPGRRLTLTVRVRLFFLSVTRRGQLSTGWLYVRVATVWKVKKFSSALWPKKLHKRLNTYDYFWLTFKSFVVYTSCVLPGSKSSEGSNVSNDMLSSPTSFDTARRKGSSCGVRDGLNVLSLDTKQTKFRKVYRTRKDLQEVTVTKRVSSKINLYLIQNRP